MTNLFDDEPPSPKKPRTTRLLDAHFDAIAELVGPATAKASAGRVVKMAKEMHKAGLIPSKLATELPLVVARYAPWRKVIDLATVQSCWPWILQPPKTVEPSPLANAQQAIEDNGGVKPF